MTLSLSRIALGLAAVPVFLMGPGAGAHKLHQKGVAVAVAESAVTVAPSRDWNQLGRRPGKNSETWTIDGEQLNDVTFFGGIPADKPLVKERSKKKDPLPKFTKATLLVEVPELLEGTHRTYKNIGAFEILSTEPAKFLGQDGIFFTYEYTDADEQTRKGEARAAIIGGKLYMITFEAPRLSYYGKTVGDFRALADTAVLR